ncbi:MAG: MBL fold metallo-hydrolase [Chlorobiaceae bacterium]|nr:MBL fold metallo-hydrolase [Chlorobiaceae bacterium]NTV26592.1 MBL fold metallo-hydrolase [Chlorobiaceae bacterium]
MMKRIAIPVAALSIVLLLWTLPSRAGGVLSPESAGLRVERLDKGVYAVIGSTAGRTYDNVGMNANFGFIDTPDGVILIDSGASAAGAELLDTLVHRSTGKPVRWVVNTGSQDHRWLGNGYFASKGAEIIALQRTATTQRRVSSQQIQSLYPVLRERLDGTRPVIAPSPVLTDESVIRPGGVTLILSYLADAHFPGDIVVRLPDTGIMFAGDHLYVGRMLGILPESNPVTWLDAFNKLSKLKPKRIVPGHGRICTLRTAQRDTGDYLDFIVGGVQPFAENLAGVEQAVSALSHAPQFSRLEHFDTLHRANISSAYLQMESQ